MYVFSIAYEIGSSDWQNVNRTELYDPKEQEKNLKKNYSGFHLEKGTKHFRVLKLELMTTSNAYFILPGNLFWRKKYYYYWWWWCSSTSRIVVVVLLVLGLVLVLVVVLVP